VPPYEKSRDSAGSVTDSVDFKTLFNILKQYDDNSYLMGASRNLDTDKEMGIIGGHAYSVISLMKYEDVELI